MTENILGTFFTKEEGRAYECNEGDITVAEGYSCLNGAKQKFLNFEDPITAECFLEFDLGSGKDLCVKGATTKATHITMYEAEFPSGALPTEDIDDGSYKRFVTAYQLKVGEIQLPLADDNSAIVSGDFLALDDYDGGLDKYTGSTASDKVCLALESKSANTGGYIICQLLEPFIPFQ